MQVSQYVGNQRKQVKNGVGLAIYSINNKKNLPPFFDESACLAANKKNIETKINRISFQGSPPARPISHSSPALSPTTTTRPTPSPPSSSKQEQEQVAISPIVQLSRSVLPLLRPGCDRRPSFTLPLKLRHLLRRKARESLNGLVVVIVVAVVDDKMWIRCFFFPNCSYFC